MRHVLLWPLGVFQNHTTILIYCSSIYYYLLLTNNSIILDLNFVCVSVVFSIIIFIYFIYLF